MFPAINGRVADVMVKEWTKLSGDLISCNKQLSDKLLRPWRTIKNHAGVHWVCTCGLHVSSRYVTTSPEWSKWSLKSSIDVLTHEWEMGIDVLNDFWSSLPSDLYCRVATVTIRFHYKWIQGCCTNSAEQKQALCRDWVCYKNMLCTSVAPSFQCDTVHRDLNHF